MCQRGSVGYMHSHTIYTYNYLLSILLCEPFVYFCSNQILDSLVFDNKNKLPNSSKSPQFDEG